MLKKQSNEKLPLYFHPYFNTDKRKMFLSLIVAVGSLGVLVDTVRPLPVPPHVAPIVEAGVAVAAGARLHARVYAAVSDHVGAGGKYFTALTTRELAAAAPWREHLLKLLQQQVLSSSDKVI